MEPEAVGSGSAAPATEQPIKDPKVAKKWLTAAQQLVAKGDYFVRANRSADAKAQYENAVTAYVKAIEAGAVDPPAGDSSLYFSLASAEEKAGSLPDAYRHYKQVAGIEGMKPDVVKKAQAKLDEIASKVGIVMLDIKPEGASISMGGKQIAVVPLTEALVLIPGSYTFSFAAVGYQPKDLEIKLEAGSETERKIELEPVPDVIKPSVVEPEPEKPGTIAAPSLVPVYVAGGVTGLLLVIATATGIGALQEHGTFTDPKTSHADRLDAQSHGRSLEHYTDLCLTGALAAAAFGGYWYWYKYRKPLEESSASGHAKLDVVPWVQPEAGGLFVAGSF
jgi:hypothetical protein